jgi:hypothetical protein
MIGCASRMDVHRRGRYLLKKLRPRNNKLQAKNICIFTEYKLIDRKYK